MSRIKGPNCGSTAQVDCIYLDTRSETEKVDDYACGCGCVFSLTYTVTSVDIQNADELKNRG